jgi:hypothetical protein
MTLNIAQIALLEDCFRGGLTAEAAALRALCGPDAAYTYFRTFVAEGIVRPLRGKKARASRRRGWELGWPEPYRGPVWIGTRIET